MAKENEKSGKKKPTQYMKEAPFITLPLQAYKIRRNMLLCASLCAFQAIYGQLGGQFTVLGNNLFFPRLHFDLILVVISSYFTIYFTMLGKSTVMKWRLRSTGQPDSLANTSTGAMFAGSQSNIEVSQTTAWQTIDSVFSEIKNSTKNCIEAVSNLVERDLQKDSSVNDSQNLSRQISEIAQSTRAISSKLSTIEECAESTLAAFDKEFWIHQKTTQYSFYLLEYYGPLGLSTLAIVGLILRSIFNIYLCCPEVT